jgi:hypothetical protein
MTVHRPMFPPPRGEALPLSALFLHPMVADAFARAEREPGMALTVAGPFVDDPGRRRRCAAFLRATGTKCSS